MVITLLQIKLKMSVNYTIRRSDISSSATTINIPITMTPQITDQSELVKTKFIDVEVEKAINPIFDYEKARFFPIYFPNSNNTNVFTKVENIIYNVKFIASSAFPSGLSKYGDIGITDDDIRYGKKRFENSFLNLSFYDSDRATDQRLISYIDVYPRLSLSDIQTAGDPKPGLPKPAASVPITFILSDTVINPSGFAEGFYLYNYKDEVSASLPKELYMRARFNNAANGKTTNMMTEGVPYYINDLVHKLYTKFVLYRNNTGYYYVIDETYSNNVIRVGNDVTINIYEIQAL
jgi:hypothetical protein